MQNNFRKVEELASSGLRFPDSGFRFPVSYSGFWFPILDSGFLVLGLPLNCFHESIQLYKRKLFCYLGMPLLQTQLQISYNYVFLDLVL